MSKLTKAARGQECTVQIHPFCNMNAETTVLAHAPCEDKCMSKKSPDWWGADCCSDCHDIIDGRRSVEIYDLEIYKCHIRGVYRTIKRRIEMGLIDV